MKTFHDELCSITRKKTKRNVLVIGGDVNAQLGQDIGNKFAYHEQAHKNGTMLSNFLKEQNLLNTYLQEHDDQRPT